jgi:SynChlorMet cassette radical SAM/SPASM protein ScmE
MQNGATLIAHPGARLREAAPGQWELTADDAGAVRLNGTALGVWRQIDGRRSLSEVVDGVLGGFEDPPAEAGDQIRGVVGGLIAQGLVQVAAGTLAWDDEQGREWLRAAAPAVGPLRSVEIAITARCNARCLYCYHFDNPGVNYEDLPAGEWLTFFAELGRLGVADVTLAGGEPFVRADLRELIAGIAANGMRFSLLSNGALLTDDLAAYLAGTGYCDGVQISVDGSHAATHDAARGAGSFAGAMRALAILRRHGLRANVRVTIHHFNVDDLEATATLLLDELGIAAFGTNAAGYLGSCRLHSDGLQLTVAERERAMRTLVALAARYPGRIHAAAGPLADARLWGRMEAARREAAPPFGNGGCLTACGCPWNKLSVLADGSMVVCTMLPHLVLGRINHDDLGALWRSHPLLVRHRRRRQIPLSRFAQCEGCAYMPYCTGNCPGPAYTLTGEVDHPGPDSCLRNFLASGGSLLQDVTIDG